jgi:hypothetical protein
MRSAGAFRVHFHEAESRIRGIRSAFPELRIEREQLRIGVLSDVVPRMGIGTLAQNYISSPFFVSVEPFFMRAFLSFWKRGSLYTTDK